MKNKRIIRIISVFLIAAVSSLFLVNHYSSSNKQAKITSNTISFKDYENDKVLGNQNAPITLVEYGSLTCVHCASFHTNEFLEIEEKYIKTGEVKYIYRHFPLDKIALVLSYFAEKIPTDKYYDFILDVYKDQDSLRTLDSVEYLKKITKNYIKEDELNEILNDPNGEILIDKIVSNKADFINNYGIEGTPTFFLYGPNGLNLKLSRNEVKKMMENNFK